jgi:hypothetical protein
VGSAKREGNFAGFLEGNFRGLQEEDRKIAENKKGPSVLIWF